ncbi:DNA mismatch repair endonuclease MutL [Fructilactobacillus fructivorans]|uniref:DNA mismatch repair endonuclease MutL n=1 Tax=Fructilactobacillus fructivorans TaxID=1614 RepID=UPI0007054E3F|nr:DNA mismatch repair endonuclease MutL [Fructilactobacillus fructivorans]KRN40732.1 DNA mismatch repair protein mutL [Fructilactobacillus fructivorans]KRN42411.1 DNA mismatch repair protein mutL [Fructilactobacillus fructivorans]
MADIHQLPTILSDQISAGEVVERPASVVKELVENSIDANSTKIDIVVAESGLKSVEVVDNGSGIASNQVELAFRRFATSKISDKRDLFRVRSLGFRGEALPSIASVSDVDMKTSDGKKQGAEIQIHGGKVVKMEPSQARRGTSVLVSDLFFNTPNRLKYLKAPATELSKISDIVNRLALSHPEIVFSLTHNGRELLRTSGRNNMQQVIAGIYGNRNMKQMIAIQGENPDFKISGYISLPELTRASRKYTSVIVNGRFIRDFGLDHAIIDGYGSKLMVGRYPIVVISITMDPSLVDVNVHPSKEEIRISKKKELSTFISQTIYETLSKQNLIPEAMNNKALKNGVARHNSTEISFNLDQLYEDGEQTFHADTEESTGKPDPMDSVTHMASDSSTHQPIMIYRKADLNAAAVQNFKARYEHEKGELPFGGKTEAPNASHDFPQLRYIGQVHGTYLVAESSDGMYIVDQHAAQERINYEYYRKQVGRVSGDEQKMLVPIVLDYPASDALVISSHLDLLEENGLHLESFGKNSFVIRQHPVWFKAGQEEDTIKEMIDWILSNQQLSTAQFREKAAIMMSCKRAIKANHHLDKRQAQALLDKLPECENPFNCPHGRPVLVHFSNSDLETMFKRIQVPHQSGKNDF